MQACLPARPLRFDTTQLLIPLAVLPGLAMAALHAPVALLTFGPLVLTSWALSQRDRFRLDRCLVQIDGPALELRYRNRRLDAIDLRYAARLRTSLGDVVLSEGESSFLAFGTDPPDNAVPINRLGHLSPPAEAAETAARAGSGRGAGPAGRQAEAADFPLGFWRAVRLSGGDFERLQAALQEIEPLPLPDEDHPATLLQALGSVGAWGRRAEVLLVRHLRRDTQGARPGGLAASVKELALRQDAPGAAARRVLLVASGPAHP